jgi:hypothetical protein
MDKQMIGVHSSSVTAVVKLAGSTIASDHSPFLHQGKG